MEQNYNIFISYRRDGGYVTAKHLYDLLSRDGYSVSFDIDTLRNGDFDVELLKRIDECIDFILILNKDAFVRTLDPNFPKEKDWMRNELAFALQKNKNIIPIMLNGFTEFPDNLPSDIAKVAKKNGPKYDQYYFDDFYNKLKTVFLETPSPAFEPKNEDKQLFNVKVRSNLDFDLYIDNQYFARIDENDLYVTQMPRGEFVFSFRSVYDGAIDVIEKKVTVSDGDTFIEVDLLSIQEQRKEKEECAIDLITEKYGKRWYEFSCGLCEVEVNGLWGFVDADLKERIPCVYSEVGQFSSYSCCAIVKQKGRYGLINTDGTVVVPIEYDKIEMDLLCDNPDKDYLRCVKNGKCGIISLSGEICLPFIYQGVSAVKDARCIVKNAGKLGFYDIENNLFLLPCEYHKIQLFDDYAIVGIDNKYGVFLFENKKLIVDAIYDEIKPFHENLAAVKENGHWGFIEKSGKLQVPTKLDDCDSFSNELAPVCLKGKWGFMNHQGKLEIPIRYDMAKRMCGGRAVVSIDGKSGLIDRNGRVLYPFSANAQFLYYISAEQQPQYPILVLEDNNNAKLIDYYGNVHEVEAKETMSHFYSCIYEGEDLLFMSDGIILETPSEDYGLDDYNMNVLEVSESNEETKFFWEEEKSVVIASESSIKKLRELVIDRLEELVSNNEKVTLESDLLYDLHLDPLDLEELVMHVEEMYGVEIVDYDDIKSCKTVQDVVDFFLNYLEEDFRNQREEESQKNLTEKDTHLEKSKAESKADNNVWEEKEEISEGLICVKDKNGKYGFIDKLGKVIIPCQWDAATSCSEGLAVVANNGEGFGYIDKSGKVVIPIQPTIKVAMPFKDGKAEILDENFEKKYIDKNGNVIGKMDKSFSNPLSKLQEKIPTYDELVTQRKADWELCCSDNSVNIGETVNVGKTEAIVLGYNSDRGYFLVTKHKSTLSFEKKGTVVDFVKSFFGTSSNVDAHDTQEGISNCVKVYKIRNWQERFPALSWCLSRHSGAAWYLPAVMEWSKCMSIPNVDDFFGYKISDELHWTSTVHKSDVKEAFLGYRGGGVCGDRQHEHSVRAVAYVKEIKKSLHRSLPINFLPQQYKDKDLPYMQIKSNREVVDDLKEQWEDKTAYELILKIAVYPVVAAKYQMVLADIYKNGIIVEKDLAISTFWLLQAARSGNKEAQLQISKMFQEGDILPKDDEQAKKWHDLAEKND